MNRTRILLCLLWCVVTILASGCVTQSDGEANLQLLTLCTKAKPESGDVAEVKRLLKNGADINYSGGEPLASALNNGNAPLAETLIEQGASLDLKRVRYALITSAQARSMPESDLVKVLSMAILHGFDVNTELSPGWNLLNLSLIDLGDRRPYPAVIRMLLKHGADPAKPLESFSPLVRAKLTHNDEIIGMVKGALQGKPLYIGDSKTDFAAAVAFGDLPKVKELCKANAGLVNGFFSIQRTNPMQLAIQAVELDVGQWLLDQGSKMTYKDAFGEGPLHYAVSSGKPNAILFALAKYPKLDEQSNTGATALMSAIQEGRPGQAKLLIEKGADVNIPSEKGTALDQAIASHMPTDVIELIKSRSDPSKNKEH